MPLLRFHDVSLSYGPQPLLDHAELVIDSNERICLLGRNGTGKTSLFKLILGSYKPDGGTIYREPQLKVACLDQELPPTSDLTVYDFIALGLADIGQALADYQDIIAQPDWIDDPTLQEKVEQLQKFIEMNDGWSLHARIEAIINSMKLPAQKKMRELSGGWRRKVLLAQALVQEPDILMLDEPTNHLDIATIQWLEQFLPSFKGTILCISHDRAFVNAISDRIVELDRGQLYSKKGNYQDYLKYREQRLAAEEKAQAEFNKKLAQEETWIRQGIKARRTRNEGRVRALQKLRQEHAQRRQLMNKPGFKLSESDLSGKLVIEANEVCYRYPGNNRNIIDHFSTKIFRQDRIGLLGNNGCGKSTLLKLLLKKIEPDSGSVKLGTNLKIAYFDQLRSELDPNSTVMDNVAEGRTTINVNGKDKHIISYLGDFLFSPDRCRSSVASLSGGECNRLLLARLFSQDFNFLILDEPTNDLDIESLELLEECIINFQGTLLLVSHDRAFMDNVVTDLYVFEGQGKVTKSIGGYSDWVNNLQQQPATGQKSLPKPKTAPKARAKPGKKLDSITREIEKTEQKLEQLHQDMAQADFYQQPATVIEKTAAQEKKLSEQLSELYQRWEDLES